MREPGCFGHIVTYNTDERVCGPCEHRQACGESVQNRVQTLKRLNRYPDINSLLPGHTDDLRASDTPTATRLSAAVTFDHRSARMTKKARDLHDTLQRKGIDLSKCLLTRSNPVTKPAYLQLAVNELIEYGGYDKRGLKQAYQINYDWTPGTASSHVGIVTSLFAGLDLVEVDGRYVRTKE